MFRFFESVRNDSWDCAQRGAICVNRNLKNETVFVNLLQFIALLVRRVTRSPLVTPGIAGETGVETLKVEVKMLIDNVV
jgi:hypothetical protein